MSAPTVAVEWLLARAAARGTGLLHIASRRDSGALNPICGANPIRSTSIETRTVLDDAAALCDGCATMATSIGGTVHDGVALLLGLSSSAQTARLLELPIADLDLRRGHARREPGDLEQLIGTIRERGVLAPVLVYRDGRRFRIVDGARRVAAAHQAGLTTVPAIVRDVDDQVALAALIANLHHEQLNPIDQALAFQSVLDETGWTKAELARALGISRPHVSNTIRLLGLTAEDRARVAAGELTAEQGRAILAGERITQAVAAVPMPDIAAALATALLARVHVTATPDRARIVVDVAPGELERVLGQLGLAA